ncbi:MAG: ABC transporter permease, partial [Muribaculaceae bacterium]|nr:ABC transporter permease [Muribaculaceae bacterium]
GNPDQWHIGNICISDVTSVNKLRSDVNREEYQTVTGIVTCCLFLLISIFLGLLGTFWFRTGQRTVEIAIRMVNGATNRQIFTRLVTEGIILWSAALIFIGLLMFVVFKFDLLSEVIYSEMTKSIIYGTIISLVSLLIMIIAGIFFPALRASKIEPAIALKDE